MKESIFKVVLIVLRYSLSGYLQYSLPTRSTHLPARSTHLFTRSTHLSTRNTRLSIRISTRSTRLSTRSISLSTRLVIRLSTHSTCSTICRSFLTDRELSLFVILSKVTYPLFYHISDYNSITVSKKYLSSQEFFKMSFCFILLSQYTYF